MYRGMLAGSLKEAQSILGRELENRELNLRMEIEENSTERETEMRSKARTGDKPS